MLAARGLSLAFGSRRIFAGVDLVVDDGERVALVGKNGAGKSTLLRALAGLQPVDGGLVEKPRSARVGLLLQEPQLPASGRADAVARAALGEVAALVEEHARLCAGEIDDAAGERITHLAARIEELGGFDLDHRVQRILGRLSVPVDVDVASLSGGGKRRLDLARTLLLRPDVLLLDEPTNHLDTGGIAFLVEEMRAWRGAVLFVSHDGAFVDAVTTRIAELEDGVVRSYQLPKDQMTTPTASYLEQKLLRDDIASRTLHRRERLYVKELAWLRAGTPARTTKQQARIGRAQALADEIEKETEIARKRRARVDIETARASRTGKTILELKNASFLRGDRVIVDGVSVALVAGDRYGVVGENGVGKTTLLKALLSAAGADVEDPPTIRGEVVVGENTRVAFFDQHRRTLDPTATLQDTLIESGGDYVVVDEGRIHIASFLERFLFDGSDRDRKVETLSGGEQNRLALARLFLSGANLLLLDEPTNDLDAATLGVLEEALESYRGTAILVSHDRRFLDRAANGILHLEKKGAVGALVVYRGNYSTFESLRAAASSSTTTTTTEAAAATRETDGDKGKRERTKRKRSYKEQKELEGMEELVLAREARRDEVRAILNGADVYKDAAKAAQLGQELTSLDVEIERLYARWQELEAMVPM